MAAPQARPQQPTNLPAQRRQDSSAIAMPGGRQFMPSVEQWAQIKELGAAAYRSGMLPSSIKNAEAAAIVALKAYELGIPLMEGYAHIFIVDGKPTISRELMQTLVIQNILGGKIEILETTDKLATVQGSRPGHQPLKMTWTIADATRAELLKKDNWRKYPMAMLLNRAVSALCRAYFPDGLRGCSYTPEELETTFETTGRRVDHYEQDGQQDPPADEAPPIETTGEHVDPSTETPPAEPAAAPAEPVAPAQPSPAEVLAAARAAELGALVDPARWPPGSVGQYCLETFKTSKFSELNANVWGLLLNVVRNSNAKAALGEFAMMGDTRV